MPITGTSYLLDKDRDDQRERRDALARAAPEYILGCLVVAEERHALLFGAYVFLAAMVWLSVAAARRD